MFDEIIKRESLTFNVPESWIRAVISVESSWNANAYRLEPKINDASYGLMQLLAKTATGLGFTGDPKTLFDASINIHYGTKLLGQLRSQFGDDVQRIYSAYNSGKPDAYLYSAQVKANVARFITALEDWISKESMVATSGSLGVLIAFICAWYWWKRKGK